MKRLHHLFDDLNRTFWNGRLPRYRVRRRKLAGYQGTCDSEHRTIFVSMHLMTHEDKLRRVLLHEMCHVACPGSSKYHGARFQRELARLAGLGEAWAEEERQMYADPKRRIVVSGRMIRNYMDDMLSNFPDEMLKRPWRKTQVGLAHSFTLTAPEFQKRYPWARKTWQWRLARELRARQEEAILHQHLDRLKKG